MEENKQGEQSDVLETIEVPPELESAEQSAGIEIGNEGLSPQELKDAEKLGIKVVESGEGTGKDKGGEQADKDKAAEEAIKKFEKEEELTPEEEHAALDKLGKKEQAFYFRMKEDRHKRQAASTQVKLLQQQLEEQQKELEQIKNKSKGNGKGEEELEDPDLLFDKKGKTEEEDDTAIATKADVKKLLEEKEKKAKEKEEEKGKSAELARAIAEKWDGMEKSAREKEPAYDAIMDLAKEVIEKDETGAYGGKMVFLSENCLAIEDGKPNAIDYAFQLAKLHPDFNKIKTGKLPAAKENIQKIVENSKKRSSAGMAGGGNLIAVEDITPEIAARMPTSQFAKLPKWKQEQLLGNPNAKAPAD